VCCLPTGDRAEIGARSLQSQSPPGNTTLRAEVQLLPYSLLNPARQPSPGAALYPVAPHSLRITSCRAGGNGLVEEYAYLAQALMETSEDPILGMDQTSQAFTVGLYKFVTAKNTLYKNRDSRAEQHISDCVRWPLLSSSKITRNLAQPFEVTCGAFANFTSVELPTRYAPRGRNCERMAPRWRCSNIGMGKLVENETG
jgi:hypothetical protein